MEQITDEFMKEMLTRSRPYTMLMLKGTPKLADPANRPIVWEHGRRNFELRAAGALSIVCPVRDDSEWAGFGIFARTPAEVTEIAEADPAVRAGLFTYEVHPVASFPGDALPA
jgi:hypothetical protein